jgi:hypothetical protein
MIAPIPEKDSSRPRLPDLLGLLGAFVAVHVLYAVRGGHFESGPFPQFMQFIDRPLLETRMLESIWYSHAHPPLLNLFAGIGVKLFGDHADLFYATSFHLLGLMLILCAYALTLRLTASRVAALFAALLVLVNPAFVLYENWLMYTFPTAALLLLSAYALIRALDSAEMRWWLAFFGLLATVALTRSLFHLIWFVTLAGFLLLVLPGRRRQVLLAALLPFALIAGWYGKNWVYYGTFAGSTMLGLGLANISTLTFEREELLPLVEDGSLSPFALVSRYEDRPALFSAPNYEPSGIAVLDQPQKISGEYNYNFLPIIEVSDRYEHDALTLIRRHPANYLFGVWLANRLYFSPTSMNEYFPDENETAVAPYEGIFNALLFGSHIEPRYTIQPHFGFDHEPSIEINPGPVLFVATLVLTGFGYLRTRRLFLSGPAASRSNDIVIAFLLANLLYVWATGTLLELGENYRYRYLTEPLYFVLLATGAHAAWLRLRPLLSRR